MVFVRPLLHQSTGTAAPSRRPILFSASSFCQHIAGWTGFQSKDVRMWFHPYSRMADIVLATINARYAHASLALRYLRANVGTLKPRSEILEFVLQDRPVDIAEKILARSPSIVGFGVYIWNTDETYRVVETIKRVAPQVKIVVGGPEVSHEIPTQPVASLADYIVVGEGDEAFRDLASSILAGEPPETRVIRGGLPSLAKLQSPYSLYDETDISNRTVYVEASRGCPFTCEFCLSSLDQKVRGFPLEEFLADMKRLYDRGVRQFKFIDRTFNLKISTAKKILAFFLERSGPDLFVHFEMVPDRLPDELRDLVRQFPPACLQFEVGIQTFNDKTADRIQRKHNRAAIEKNIRFLREETGVHVHADLIVGLPGEDIESFGLGFDNLVSLAPQEIQVGILKRLRGTPISRHTEEWGMVYSSLAPYEILANKLITFSQMQEMKRFARVWDMVANSGNFVETLPLLWAEQRPFIGFLKFTRWLHVEVGSFSGVALKRLARLLYRYLVEATAVDRETASMALTKDFTRLGRGDFNAAEPLPTKASKRTKSGIPARQARHQAR